MAKTKVQVTLPAPSAAETRRNTLADLIQEIQLKQQGYMIQDDGQGGLSIVERPLTAEEQTNKEFQAKLQAQIQQRLLGGPVDEETKRLVGETYAARRTEGTQEIDRFLRELAGARGLDLTTDSPALQEAARAKGNLETSLGGAEAESLLNLGSRNQIFAQALNEFQNNLRQQAFINRAAIGGAYSESALNMQRERMAQPTTISKTSGGGFGLADWGQFLGGAGGFLKGLGGR